MIVSCFPKWSCDRISTTSWNPCKQAGFPISMDFFHPPFRVPFPHLRTRGLTKAWRWSCARPWNPGMSSARKPGGGGTVRYVDSSVERLQVKVTGMTEEPPSLSSATADGCPCSPRGVDGVFVPPVSATGPGSRRPACIPPSVWMRLLTIDLFDTWSQRCRCRLHLSCGPSGGAQLRNLPGQRMGSRGPPTCPLHSPAATRRAPGCTVLGSGDPTPEFPYTLDLRRR